MSTTVTTARQSISSHWVLTAIAAAVAVSALVVTLVLTIGGSSSSSSSSGGKSFTDNSVCHSTGLGGLAAC
jgi:hypothetical protein